MEKENNKEREREKERESNINTSLFNVWFVVIKQMISPRSQVKAIERPSRLYSGCVHTA